ncbi:MAG: hypothetical protein ABJG15_16295 [Hyphomonadaceae bacterium]
MVDTRKPSGNSAGWMPAFVFNSLLFLIPLLAVKALSATMPDEAYLEDRSAAVLAEARRSMDQTFANLPVTDDQSQREYWASLVNEQLQSRNMAAARGFLLAAPEMLSSDDARAIEAAAQADPSGTEDQRLLRASLLFLPSYVRLDYESSLHPRGQELITAPEIVENTQAETTRAVASVNPNTTTRVSVATMTYRPTFSVLGRVEDLVQNSRSWLRGSRNNEFAVKLTGLAMASPPSATGLSPNRLQTAASVLKTAWKSDRLQDGYAAKLTATLHDALPEDVLRANLEAAMADIAPLNVRAMRVQNAFAQSVDAHAAARIGNDLEELAVIAEATSIPGAVNLLEHVNNLSELRHARIIAEAGGDRAVALVAQMGPEALTMNVQTVRWSQSAILQIMALAAALIALLLSVMASLQHALREARTNRSQRKKESQIATTEEAASAA